MSRHRDYFNQMAAQWDSIYTREGFLRLTHIIAQLDIRPGATVLDVGSGTGILLPLLTQAVGEKGRIVALDFAEEMLSRAKAKGFAGNIEYIVADASDMPLPDGSFDWVICNAVFPHFPDKSKALTEIARVLKRRGKLAICHVRSRQAVNEMHRTIGGAIADDLIPDDGEVRQLLAASGFAGIEIEDGADRYIATAMRA